MLSDAELTGKRDASDNHVINGDVLDILSYMERFIYKLMFCSTIMAPFIANRFDQPVSPKLSMETVPTLKKDTEHILPVLLHVNGRTVFIWDIYKELFNLLHDEVQIDLEFHVHPDKRSYAGLVTRKSKISEITSYTDITDNSLVTDSLTKLTRSATKSPELVTSRIWIDMAKIMNKQGGQ